MLLSRDDCIHLINIYTRFSSKNSLYSVIFDFLFKIKKRKEGERRREKKGIYQREKYDKVKE